MCVAAEIPIAMGAISAAGTAAAYIGQQQQADAQSNFQSNTYKYVKKSATANYYQQVSQIENRVGQEKVRRGRRVDEGQPRRGEGQGHRR
jgi:hypothetical protein